jgi:hypothetical protein
MDNVYIVDYNKRVMTARESTSLVHKEENEEVIVPPKLGHVLEPSKDDSDTQTQNSIAIYENPYTSCEGFRNLETLPILMHLCWIVMLLVKLLIKRSVA